MTRRSLTPDIAATARLSLGAAALMLLVGCSASDERPNLDVDQDRLVDKIDRENAADPDSTTLTDGTQTSPFATPAGEKLTVTTVPGSRARGFKPYANEQQAPLPDDRLVDTAIAPLALPAFIDVVFGQILKLPYATGPNVAKRTDTIQLRSSGNVSAKNFLSLVDKTLQAYGVRITTEQGIYQLVEEASVRDLRPRFYRSRTRPSTPASLRPIVQFVQLRAVSPSSMATLIGQTFPRSANLQALSDQVTGSLILIGLPEDVDAAIDVVDALDVPQFADAQMIQFRPVFWQVEELATQVQTLLQAEGWQASTDVAAAAPILMVPVPFSNQLVVFIKEPPAMQRVSYWLQTLDQPSRSGDADQIFIYDVRNTEAAKIADTANAVLAGMNQSSGPSQPGGQAAAGRTGAGGAGAPDDGEQRSGEIIVDAQGNRLIYAGSASQYERLLPLLRRLDTPTPEVLIEVTVVEIDLGDNSSVGVDFTANDGGETIDGNGFDLGDALVTLASGTSLGFTVTSGDVFAALSALAANDRVEILSTPRLVARSGGSANIQIGDDVPIISSQGATGIQAPGGGSDVLQTVSFRSTGILLEIEPIVYSNGRVDLTITQEVSASSENTLTDVSNPIISNTMLTTQLTLEDGATAVMGGLIQNNITENNSGVPFLKDIPYFGRLFRNESLTISRSEVLLIINAYIIQDAQDREKFVNYLVGEINGTLSSNADVRTILPYRGR